MQKHDEYVKQLGRNAKAKGIPLEANPYIEGSNDADLWAEGWKEAVAKTPENLGKRK